MYKKSSVTIIILAILFATYSAMHLGPSWDTFFHYELGKERLDYLFSFGANKLNNNQEVIKYYPGSYATIQAFLVQFFPQKKILESIHFINLLFSVGTLFGISKIAKIFFNKVIGKITFFVCFFNPIFFGHMASSSMDMLITFCNVWLLYLIIKYLKNQNNSEKLNKYIILIALTLGVGLGVRLTFIATIIPFLLFLLAEIIWLKNFITENFSLKKFFFDLFKILFIAYFTLILFWPHTHDNVFKVTTKLVAEDYQDSLGPWINWRHTVTNNFFSYVLMATSKLLVLWIPF